MEKTNEDLQKLLAEYSANDIVECIIQVMDSALDMAEPTEKDLSDYKKLFILCRAIIAQIHSPDKDCWKEMFEGSEEDILETIQELDSFVVYAIEADNGVIDMKLAYKIAMTFKALTNDLR